LQPREDKKIEGLRMDCDIDSLKLDE